MLGSQEMQTKKLSARLVSLTVLVLLAASPLFAESAQEKETRLQGRLVASCCWAEPISIHRSEAAAEMRARLHSLIVAGRSDREILDDFTAQYGKRVLIEPEGGLGIAAYALPILAIALGLFAVLLVLRGWLRTRQPA